jgi:hypothetical protein
MEELAMHAQARIAFFASRPLALNESMAAAIMALYV